MMDKKVFIIESDANFSHGLQALLSIGGFQVRICDISPDKDAVIGQLKRFAPDYIIQDVYFPNFSGIDLLALIREDDQTSGTPIFVYADTDNKTIKEKCENLGADYFFSKDILNVEQFKDRFIKVIKNREKTKKE